jgi:hypothetical protein
MSKQLKEYPGHSHFVFQAPMYSKFRISQDQENELIAMGIKIEGLCIDCGEKRVFGNKGNSRTVLIQSMTQTERMASDDTISFRCSFNADHQIRIFPVLKDGVLEKCGQKPSYAELAQFDDRELTKGLSEQDRREYYKAVGLAAHDTGIGAYAYLRRIFENLVYSRFEENKAAQRWDEDAFKKLRMSEKITFLNAYLPQLLVQNAAAYGILSDGIHNLTENDCLDFFPTLRTGTLLILQRAREIKERQQLEKQFTANVAAQSSKPKTK